MNKNSYKIALILLMMAFIGTQIWAIYERNVNGEMREEMDRERLKSEELLSEKLILEKERDKSKKRIDEITSTNDALSHEISEVDAKLAEVNTKLKKALGQNTIERKKYSELLAAKENLEKELEDLKEHQHSADESRRDLAGKIASLESDNQALRSQVAQARMRRYDQAIVESTRGSNAKLIVKARRVQKLRGSLTVTSDVQDPISIRIKAPDGTTLSEQDGNLSHTVTPGQDSKEIEVTYIPKNKLIPGIYIIEVLGGNLEVGSLQVRFR